MKPLILLFSLSLPLLSFSQHFHLKPGSDTIRIGLKDTVSLDFRLSKTKVSNSVIQVIITHHSGTAEEGIEYKLLDAYHAPVDTIRITNVENNTGSFKMKVIKELEISKTVKLNIIIIENGRRTSDQATIVLMKNGREEISRKDPVSDKSDSLTFINVKDINIEVWNSDTTKVVSRKSRIGRPVITRKVNIYRIQIKQIKKTEYRIEILTTDNEIFYSTIEVTLDYKFKADDKLYLNGDNSALFLRAKEIFMLYLQEKNEKPRIEADNEVYKFPF